ncbi:Ig-like domain-containing protein [uncultured Methanobrevibacter sp.]|uniref:Ig-like domain-containing protein n=1 Tax=uncultured Methanobrevibacter sp. TaxID=253161 RepID=UPI0025DE176A|nr:Ig-like domain-containing protein [uncultured Methanobrevibacter sp.]
MKKGIILIILSLILIFSVNFISASELTNSSLEISSNDNLADNIDDIPLNSMDDSNELNQISDNSVLSEPDDFIEIWIGQNKTIDGGDGSPENPFATLYLACDYANTKNTSQITLNIYNGTYELLDSPLKFNTSNLIVNGIGSPTIRSSDSIRVHYQGFSLVSSSSNYTFSNINTIDCLFNGNAKQGTFNNCSFISSSGESLTLPDSNNYELKFNNCRFETSSSSCVFLVTSGVTKSQILNIKFENCIFNLPNCPSLIDARDSSKVTMINCWLGRNTFPSFIKPSRGYIVNSRGAYVTSWSCTVESYAQFNVTKNYISNNTYEIIGKLTWDDENNTASMENFQPMNVSLSSNTGKIQSSAILTNGTFRAIYTGDSNEHSIVAILGSEIKELKFKSINFTVDAPSIFYGDDQNINITFPYAINATVNIIVNNKTYNLTVNDTSINYIYTIEDILTEGNYTVEVILNDDVNQVYGSNSTILSVSKVSDYIFEVVPISEVKVGENATIYITLPSDVSGNVTVKFGNDTQILPANQTMTVKFGNLNATTYPIIVSYSGNDKYVVPDDKIDSITVDPAKSSVNIENVEFIYGETIVIPFTIENATAVKAKILKGTSEIENVVVESTNIFVNSDLDVGIYTVEVTTIVTSNYEETTETAILTINKANSRLIIFDKEFIYGEDAIINVETINSTGDVIATLMDENNIKIAVAVSGNNITLPLLNVGKYTLIVTTNADENHNNATESATITITKTIPSMEATIEPSENITVKDDVTLTVKLPSDATGDVVIKVNGKKLYNVSANETITINLSNDAGDYVVDIIYSGDKNYESDMSTNEFTISKAKTTITANPIIFEEGNSSTIEVTIPDVESGFIFVDVGDEKFYGDINDGKATVLIKGLPAGNYTAKISFAGDKKFSEATGNTTVNVSAAPDIIGELEKIINELNGTVINQTGIIDSQKEQISSLNGTVINQTGIGTVINQTGIIDSQKEQISSLNDTVINQTGIIDSQKEQINNLTHKKDAILVVDKTFTRVAVDTSAGEKGGMFYAILKDSDNNVLANKTVQIAINGKIYTRTTDDQGRAGIQVNFANANTYSYAISFQGDDTYNAAPMASSKLTVTKKKTSIKASNKVFKVKTKTKKISVTLKTVKNQYDKKTYLKSGKKVTLKVNGKTYTAKINKKGVAKFTIKITKKGKYTAKIKFAGDKTYKASSKTIKIRIK